MANWYYKKKMVSQNVFVIFCKNEITNEIERLSSFNFKDYKTAVESLKEELIKNRIKNQKNENEDMTEVVKGYIEVHTKLDGIVSDEIIKTYNYSF